MITTQVAVEEPEEEGLADQTTLLRAELPVTEVQEFLFQE
jgi:hypothetical protein